MKKDIFCFLSWCSKLEIKAKIIYKVGRVGQIIAIDSVS
jgi:hypothetical protein